VSTKKVLWMITIVFTLQLSLITSITKCELASNDEMDQVCINWLRQYVAQNDHWAGSLNPAILTINDIKSGDILLGRIYFISPDGFILVPALKEMNPIKAYSEKYSPDISIDDGFPRYIKDLLSERYILYKAIYGSLEALQPPTGEVLFGRNHRTKWAKLNTEESSLNSSLDLNLIFTLDEAGPLLTSSWHQNSPYNNFCPDGDVGTCLAGCVAVAAAQIMNFHQWPPHGVGSKTFSWDGDQSCGDTSAVGAELTVDLLNQYSWTNMPDSCEDNCQWQDSLALAELNYEIAVAMETNFGSCGSGVSSDYAIWAYENYFMYDTIMAPVYRDDYSTEEWFNLIKAEIDNNRPVQYFIPGHSTVCDGYRDNGETNELHINYGWGGPFSGWYILDSLNYSLLKSNTENSRLNEYMITNIIPKTSPILEYVSRTVSDSLGDGDGHADASDTVEIAIKVHNSGFHAYEVNAFLSTEDPYITILNETAGFGDSIAWGEEKISLSSCKFTVNPLCPDPYTAYFLVEIVSLNSSLVIDSFSVFIGDDVGFADDMEQGEGNWTIQAVEPPAVNEWHQDSYRSHSPSISWKVGGIGAENYSNDSESKLISPYILLPVRPRMAFWHRINAEINPFDSSAFDGGMVMISTEINDWTIIYPPGGYPYSSFGIPCFSGSHEWNRIEFNLEEYSGVVRFMLVFFSNRSGTFEGWYIDDFEVFSGVLCGDANRDDIINVSDIVYLINYIFISGSSAPHPLCSGDSDGNGIINISDAIWNINYIFIDGNHPIPGCCD
jgi:Peptidase C10 family/Dockerin type I domain